MISPIPSRPDAIEYAFPYEAYIKLVPGGDILAHLEQQIDGTFSSGAWTAKPGVGGESPMAIRWPFERWPRSSPGTRGTT
jgi:hypothetical protein